MEYTNRTKINEIDELVQYEITRQSMEDVENNEFLTENYKTVQKLNFSTNSFKEISPIFLKFESLIVLDISKNKIKQITNLENCRNLEILILSHNEIKIVGSSLCTLNKLQHLDISHNKIFVNSSLIKSFKYNTELISLALEENFDYDFEKVKFLCLEFLKRIEYLDKIQIFIQTFSNDTPISVDISFKDGSSIGVRKIKDYIKLKKEKILNNEELYTINTNRRYKESEFPGTKTSYYFENLLNKR